MEEAHWAAAGRIQVAARRWRVRRLLYAMRCGVEVSAAVVIQAAGRGLLARARRLRAEMGSMQTCISSPVQATQAKERERAEQLATRQLGGRPTAVRVPRRRRKRGGEQPVTQEPRHVGAVDVVWVPGGGQEAVALSVESVDAERTEGSRCTGTVQDAVTDEPSWLVEAERILRQPMGSEGEPRSDFPAPILAPSGPAAVPRRSGGRQRRQRRLKQQQQRRSREQLAAQERERAARPLVERELQEYTAQVVAAGEEAQRIAQVLLEQMDHLEPLLDRSEGWGETDGDASTGRVGYDLEVRIAELEAIACIAEEVDKQMSAECAAFEARCVAAGIVTGQKEARVARLARLETFLSQARSFRDGLLAECQRRETAEAVLARGLLGIGAEKSEPTCASPAAAAGAPRGL